MLCMHELESDKMVASVMEDIGVTDTASWLRFVREADTENDVKNKLKYKSDETEKEALKNAAEIINDEAKAKARAEKREAKKKRQKERKKAGKVGNGDDDENHETENSNGAANVSEETENTNDYDDNEDEENSLCGDSEEQIDINAAFVKDSVKRNKNISINTTSTVSKVEKGNSSVQVNSGPMPKSVEQNISKMNRETAEKYAIHGYQLAISYNYFGQAVEQLTQAISLFPNDIRHFLNRSYCYLRLGEYTSALSDARFAKKCAQSVEERAMAVAREGQALCGMHQYNEAEKCFEETMLLKGNKWILGELILVRVLQLSSMGFSKIDSLKALHQCSSVTDAVTLLTSGNISSPELDTNVNKSEVEYSDEDEIYSSDDESSSSNLLLKLVSTLADESSYFQNLQSQPFTPKIEEYERYSERTIKSSSSMESITHDNGVNPNENAQWEVPSKYSVISKFNQLRSIPTTSKMQNRKTGKPVLCASSSIWVGSIDSSITDFKLRESFSKFGEINYIRRFPDKNFVFIDFNNKKASTRALNSGNDIIINGIKLPVKPAPGVPGKK